jgi:hypothetical protein
MKEGREAGVEERVRQAWARLDKVWFAYAQAQEMAQRLALQLRPRTARTNVHARAQVRTHLVDLALIDLALLPLARTGSWSMCVFFKKHSSSTISVANASLRLEASIAGALTVDLD